MWCVCVRLLTHTDSQGTSWHTFTDKTGWRKNLLCIVGEFGLNSNKEGIRCRCFHPAAAQRFNKTWIHALLFIKPLILWTWVHLWSGKEQVEQILLLVSLNHTEERTSLGAVSGWSCCSTGDADHLFQYEQRLMEALRRCSPKMYFHHR